MSKKKKIPKLTPEGATAIAEAIRQETAQPAFRLSIVTGRAPSLTESKLGGVPYWPIHDGTAAIPYPETSKGQKLMLLAQLRLDAFVGDGRLPDCGLLQFFIDATDTVSGMDFEDGANADGFRVVWHEEIDETVTADEVTGLGMPVSTKGFATEELCGNPVNGEFPLLATPYEACMSVSDGRFDEVFEKAYKKIIGKPAPDGAGWWELMDDDTGMAMTEALDPSSVHHAMFGYPFFTQFDPREHQEGGFDRYDTLLLQIDSEGEKGTRRDLVLWGDVGICNFFINGDKLRQGDFSDVLYNWDCY